MPAPAQHQPANKPTIKPVMQLRPSALALQYDLMIYGDIGESWWGESVTAADVVAQLNALPVGTQQINVRINSYGGSVSDGLAIYNALKRNPANIEVSVDGVAMSSASLIAMAGDSVLMPATSVLMIHAPWGMAQGNANDMRDMAQVLDTFATGMAGAYTAKSGMSTSDVLALLQDGKDHYYTGDQAVAAGFADQVVDATGAAPQPDPEDPESAPDPTLTAASLQRYIAQAPRNVQRLAIAAAARMPAPAPVTAADITAFDFFRSPQGAQALAHFVSLHHAAAAASTGVIDMPNPVQAATAEPAADVATITAAAHAALRTRNTEIQAVLEPYMARTGVSALYTEALADPSATVDSVRAKLLPILGANAEPAGSAMHVQMGATETEKMRGAAEQMLLARYNVINGPEAEAARQGNPFARSSLLSIGEHFMMAGGANTRTMGREELARRVLASQTSSDFPVLLENVMHKVLIGGYNAAPFTWTRFCTTGTLMDYRPHGRYHLSSFSDLLPTNERGEYENGVLGDAQKETITGSRKGRILEITPEIIINDDLGALVRVAGALGQAAGRTIEKDVYALFAMNGGAGPTMSDGYTLFHANHSNIAATPAAPGVTSFDLARQALAQQKDPAGNDFLDILPAIWLGPLSLGGAARVTNRSEYDPDATSKLQRPNIVLNQFKDIVDTPRLSGTTWFALADPGTEPVFEVAFLDGVQTPTLEQELNFRTDGIAWKAAHRYGVGAVGWRGALKNAGA